MQISPSILAADFTRLGDQVAALEKAGADLVHCDVMDGAFVPTISFGSGIVEAVGSRCSVPLDIHLMVENPADQFRLIAGLNPRIVTFHVEAVEDPLKVVSQIRSRGVLAGVAIKPKTPIERLLELLPEIAVALVMTVEPGKGGQSFMPEMIPRIADVAKAVRDGGLATLVEVDGGIDMRTIRDAARAGADIFVAGTAVFGNASGVGDAVAGLRKIALEAARR